MDAKPWLPYAATEYIRRLRPLRAFEWGSGGSTLFFCELGVSVVAIEHNQDWYDKTNILLYQNAHSWTHYELKYIPFESGCIGSNPANPIHYKSASTELGEVNFRQYASAIDGYDKFDLILVDGMARAACLYHAASHVAEGGCIVLDNAERDYYLMNTAFLFEGWERVEFTGYGPQLDYQWKTLFLINRRKVDYDG